MRKAFKYRIYANKQVIANAERWLELCRNLYNTALSQKILIYRQNKGRISCFSQEKQLRELKQTFPEYKTVDAQCLCNILERLDGAYEAFFRRIKEGFKPGFPRFKSKNRYDSFTLKKQGWRLDGKYLMISKIGKFKLKLSRPIEGDVGTVTLKRERTGRWFVNFDCKNVPECKLPDSDKVIGLDVGIESFCVDSEGNKVDNPLYMKQAKATLRLKNRRVSRKVKFSNRWRKARMQLARAYEEVRNQRNDFLHKLANEYVKSYGVICVEDLDINGLREGNRLAKFIDDSPWGKFFELLSYKAEGAGRQVIKVNPKGTSQMCSRCNEKVEKSLAERTHRCPYCGLVLDRDVNAAKNICAAGQVVQASTCEVAQCVA